MGYKRWWTTKEDYSLANVVFVFGDTDSIKDENRFLSWKIFFQMQKIVGCSSSGNIFNSQVTKFQIVATAIAFDKATVEISTINFNDNDDIENFQKN